MSAVHRPAMSGLRIIGGAFRGRRLVAPRGLETRPLPDRVKQALFDWLGQRLDGLFVVDCCAGSGAFTFEAFSRGARRVEAIEPGRHALPVLRANAATFGNPPGLIVHALPFEAGERVEVIVLPASRSTDGRERYPLQGTPYRYDDPTEPVAPADWEAAK